MSERDAYTTNETAQRLGIPASTLTRWRKAGVGPPAIKLGRHIRYPSQSVLDWLDRCVAEQITVTSGPLRVDLSGLNRRRGTGYRADPVVEPLTKPTVESATVACTHPYDTRTNTGLCRSCNTQV